MTFLPIAERELRVASRRKGTWRLRFFLALLALALWFLLFVLDHGPVARRGMTIFLCLSVVAFAYCLLAGVFLTADCVSQERREGTLGLLFLTDLGGHDIVLGKLITTSLQSFYSLLGILPLLALPLLMGGVSVNEFWRVSAVLCLTLLFSLAVGMLVSVFCSDSRQAIALTLLVLLLLAGLLPSVYWLRQAFSPAVGGAWLALLYPSPGCLFSVAFDTNYNPKLFQGSAWLVAAMVVVLLIAASLALGRVWRGTMGASGVSLQLARMGSLLRGFVPEKKLALQGNPFRWLVARERLPRWTGLTLFSLLGVVWAVFAFPILAEQNRMVRICFPVALFLAYAIHVICKIYVAIESTRRLTEDRQNGALELILAAPVGAGELVEGIRQGLAWVTSPSVWLVAVLNAVFFFLVVSSRTLDMRGNDLAILFEMLGGGALLLFADAYALKRAGMLMALKQKSHQRAILATLARVMLPNWVLVLLFVFVGIGGRAISPETMMAFVLVWVLLGCGVSLAVGGMATQELLRIRHLVSEPGKRDEPETEISSALAPPPRIDPARP